MLSMILPVQVVSCCEILNGFSGYSYHRQTHIESRFTDFQTPQLGYHDLLQWFVERIWEFQKYVF